MVNSQKCVFLVGLLFCFCLLVISRRRAISVLGHIMPSNYLSIEEDVDDNAGFVLHANFLTYISLVQSQWTRNQQ